MTVTPPPSDEAPPPHVPPPPGEPPSGRQPPAVSMWFVLQGILLTIPISFLLFFGLESLDLPTPGVGILFAALVFAGGGGLCFVRKPRSRGLGIGLMSGWAILSIISGGVCTGFTRFLI